MQPPIGCECHTSLLGDGDEIPQMPQLHSLVPCLLSITSTLQSISQSRQENPNLRHRRKSLECRRRTDEYTVSALARSPGMSARIRN